jgi:hypothetical protein
LLEKFLYFVNSAAFEAMQEERRMRMVCPQYVHRPQGIGLVQGELLEGDIGRATTIGVQISNPQILMSCATYA